MSLKMCYSQMNRRMPYQHSTEASTSATPVRLSAPKTGDVSKGLKSGLSVITQKSIPDDGISITGAGIAIQLMFIFHLSCNGVIGSSQSSDMHLTNAVVSKLSTFLYFDLKCDQSTCYNVGNLL
jgi:hypothetical protein